MQGRIDGGAPSPIHPSAGEGASGSGAGSHGHAAPTLAETALSGNPVEAGQALATLDRQNGSRAATDAQVAQPDPKPRTTIEREVGGDSASVTASRPVTVAGKPATVSAKGTIDDKGASGQATVKAGAASGGAGGGVQWSPSDGVTVRGNVSGDIGPVSGKVTVEHTQGPDGTTDTTGRTVTLKTPEGKPVTASIEYEQTSVRQLTRNDDGSTTYAVTGETKLTLAGGIDAKQVKVDASWTNGQRTVNTITVPKGVDVRSIDVTQPTSWPKGTRVEINSENYKGSTLGVAYARFGVEAGSEVRDGRSIVLERGAGESLSVQTGPTAGFTTSGKLKVDLAAGFGVALGGENKTDFTFFRTYTLDLGSAGGRAAAAGALLGRDAPTANGNGVSDLMSVTTGNWNYTGTAQVNTPFGSFGPQHKEGAISTWRTFGDGHVEFTRTYSVNGDGKPDVSATASSADGKTFGPTTYRLSVTVPNDATQLRNMAGLTNRSDLKFGDRVTVELSAAQVQDLRARDPQRRPITPETPEVRKRMQDAYVDGLARMGGGRGEGLIDELFSLSHAPKGGIGGSARPIDPAHILPYPVTVTRP